MPLTSSELRFPVGQYSGRWGILCRSGGLSECRGCLSLSIGSQWIRHLPDQGNRSRWSRRRYFGISVSQSGNILAVGAYNADPGGISDAGAAYLYQLEANGSATYLTKVTAPDGAAGDHFGISVSQSGNILGRRGIPMPIRGDYPMPERLIFINWKPMDPPPT